MTIKNYLVLIFSKNYSKYNRMVFKLKVKHTGLMLSVVVTGRQQHVLKVCEFLAYSNFTTSYYHQTSFGMVIFLHDYVYIAFHRGFLPQCILELTHPQAIHHNALAHTPSCLTPLMGRHPHSHPPSKQLLLCTVHILLE